MIGRGYLARFQPGPFKNRRPLLRLEGCFPLESKASVSRRNRIGTRVDEAIIRVWQAWLLFLR